MASPRRRRRIGNGTIGKSLICVCIDERQQHVYTSVVSWAEQINKVVGVHSSVGELELLDEGVHGQKLPVVDEAVLPHKAHKRYE